MTEGPPNVSVIIPTHNRCGSLRRSLDSLRCQTYPADRFEAVVVADGCDDGSAELVRRFEAPFRRQVFEQPALGPAGARNAGVARASGEVLIFLDDDIEAEPSLVEAHARAHEHRSMRVVIGYLPVTVHTGGRLFPRQLRAWWEAMFERMREPGHRFDFRDLLSGNFSIRAGLFAQAGGFDPALVCHEDYELGVRLVKLGAEFVHVPDALGRHHEHTDLSRALERQRQEGRADLQMLDRHAEILPLTRVARETSELARHERLLRALAFDRPALGDRLMGMVLRLVGLLEYVRLRRRWRRWVDRLLFYWYWRGVADVLRSRRALTEFLGRVRANAESHGEPERLEVDLRLGLGAAERLLDQVRPCGLRLRYGPMTVGEIPPRPGAEPLNGGHLRPLLATALATPLLTALTLDLLDGQSDLARLLSSSAPTALGTGAAPTGRAR